MKNQDMQSSVQIISRRIKRLVILAFVCVSAVSAAHAAPIHWGVRGGISAAELGGDFGDATKSSLKSGLDAGVTLAVPFADRFSLSTGASYVNKGSVSEGEGTDPFGNPTGTFESKWKFDYVEVPLLLRVEITQAPGLRPYVEAGPSLGILLDAVFEPGIGPFGSQNIKDTLRPLDVGYAVGVGATLPLQSGRVGFGVRYTSAFSDAYDLDNNLEAFNRTWSLTASWSR